MKLSSKFLLVVLMGAVLPLAVLGVWLTVSTRRSGEALLRERLNAGLLRAAQEIGAKWVSRRSALLTIGEDSAVLNNLLSSERFAPHIALPVLESAYPDLNAVTQLVMVRDGNGAPRWVLDADSAGLPVLVPAADSARIRGLPRPVVRLQLPLWHAASSAPIATVEAELRADAIVPVSVAIVAGGSSVIGVIDRSTGVALLPLPFDVQLLQRERFSWAGEEWLSVRRTLDEPNIELLAAAPLTAFTLPFERAARTGLIALALVAVVSFAITIVLTRRITRSLVVLSEGADAVAGGDLDRQVSVRTQDEVGRLARAFNTMTESLQRTLAELSQRQAVAAVGEFASALAHEIRNPLSAIRLNLQHVEEKLPADAELRTPVGQSLRDIERLERTVAGALRVARTGRMLMEPIDLATPLQAAVRSALPELKRRHVGIELPEPDSTIQLKANSAALEQVFLNLLLNAAQATDAGGRIGVRTAINHERVTITVWDSGTGFPAEARERAFEPFFSTKPEGSGLGLTVAKRIVTAHRGAIDLESEAGKGTQVHVRLPLHMPSGNDVEPGR
jgi:two-component system, NtrC family, sensor histidine kinase HydH